MKIPAGMMDHDVEFFLHKGDLMILHDSKIVSFDRIPPAVRFYLEEILDQDPDAIYCLDLMEITDPIERLRQFAICRFSSFDLVADVTEGGHSHPEFTICEKRGRCPYEGTLCRSLPDHYHLSSRELQVIRVMASGLPNKLMAYELGISINTVSTHIENIANKLQVHSKRKILLWAVKNNIIDDVIFEETESVCGKLTSTGRCYGGDREACTLTVF